MLYNPSLFRWVLRHSTLLACRISPTKFYHTTLWHVHREKFSVQCYAQAVLVHFWFIMVAACGFLFYKSIICSYLQSSHFSFLWFIPISVVFFYPKRRIIKILILCKVILYIATNVSKNSDVTPVKISRTCEFSDRC